MDAAYFNPILNSIVKVMKTMVHQDMDRGEVIAKRNNLAFGEVSSLISLKGSSGLGSIAVSFPLDVIRNIAKIMLPPDSELNNEMIRDLTGEMGNMFAGGAKSEMEDAGYDFDISLPQIFAGKPHYIKHVSNEPVVFIPFTSEIGTFFVEICFTKVKKKPVIIKSKLSYTGPHSLARDKKSSLRINK
jgi:chemotaxis protein CheX